MPDSRNLTSVHWSIGTKLTITFLALAIIPMSIVTFYNLTQSRNEVTKLAKSELISLSRSATASIEQLLIENQRNSTMLAGDPLTRQFLAATEEDRQKLYPKVNKMLKNFADTHPDYLSPGLLDANGIVVAALIDKLVGKDRSFRDYFQVSIKGKPYVSDILVGRATGRPGVFLTNPVIAGDGKIIGIVLLWLKADTIWEIIDKVKVGKYGIAYLIDQDGVIIAHPNRELLYHSLGKLNSEAISAITSTIRFGLNQDTKKPLIPKSLGLGELASKIALTSEPGTYYYSSSQNNRNHIVGYSSLDKQPWTVVVDLPETQFMTSLERMATIALISIGMVALIAIIISILLAKTITHPIRLLTDISLGVMHSRPFNLSKIEKVIKGRDEIAHLGRVFRKMIVSLRESEEKYRDLVDSSPDLRYRADMDGIISFISQSVKQLSGYTIEEAIGRKLSDLYVDPEDRNIFLAEIQKNGSVNEFEAQLKKKDGTIWWASTNAYFSKDQDNNIIGVEGVTRDVTARKQAEEELRKEKEFTETALNSQQDTFFLFEPSTGKAIRWNRAFNDISGYNDEEITEMAAPESYYSPEDIERAGTLLERILETGAGSINLELICKDGRRVPTEYKVSVINDEEGKPKYLISIGRDVTERIKAEKQKKQLEVHLQQAQKIEAIGTLAGGIAHDFNNMLGVITGNISIALSNLNRDNKLYEVLIDIQESSQQAQSLTHQLLTFSKGGSPIKKISDLNSLLKKSAIFSTRGSITKCNFDLSDSLWPAEVDEGQINQVIGNLIINANQAMPNGGTITIRTENTEVDSDSSLPLTAGKYIKTVVEDQGIGISKKHLSHIFDPYYTTKQKGSGLGLATTYSIIKKHGGHIAVYSEVEQGSVFNIYLPASIEDVFLVEEKQAAIHTGQGKIIIMDDQEVILTMAVRMLESMGYETTFATDGSQAIEIYRKAYLEKQPFDLVILDLTVPGGMGGLKTIIELLKIDSNVKAVVSSGYSNDPIMANYEDYGFCGVVPKPYTLSQLSEALNQIFGEKR